MAAAVQRRAATRRRRAAAARTRMRAKREGGAAAGFPAAGTRGSGGNGVSPERRGEGPSAGADGRGGHPLGTAGERPVRVGLDLADLVSPASGAGAGHGDAVKGSLPHRVPRGSGDGAQAQEEEEGGEALGGQGGAEGGEEGTASRHERLASMYAEYRAQEAALVRGQLPGRTPRRPDPHEAWATGGGDTALLRPASPHAWPRLAPRGWLDGVARLARSGRVELAVPRASASSVRVGPGARPPRGGGARGGGRPLFGAQRAWARAAEEAEAVARREGARTALKVAEGVLEGPARKGAFRRPRSAGPSRRQGHARQPQRPASASAAAGPGR